MNVCLRFRIVRVYSIIYFAANRQKILASIDWRLVQLPATRPLGLGSIQLAYLLAAGVDG